MGEDPSACRSLNNPDSILMLATGSGQNHIHLLL